MSKPQPTMPMQVDHTEARIRPHAAFVDVIFKDAEGKFWKGKAAWFYWDMEQVSSPLEPQHPEGK